MPAKRDKRTAAKITTKAEENQRNTDEQGTEKPPAKNKGRVPKAKAVGEQAEQTEAPEKKPGRGRKNVTATRTSDENGSEAAKNVPKRGQALKKTETEKSKDTGNDVTELQRKGASRATKKDTKVGEVVAQARGRKATNKGAGNEDGEPAVKKLRNPAKTKDSNEAKPKRKVRQQKKEPKGKEVNEEGNELLDNGDSAQGADRSEELRVSVEHWYV
ncbi:hypothetical protein B7P43_G00633 [Cryptotermes secundus]|uniref:Uncharacterized protein n=1 Tax=Cryptotermes secundus TaxID=105785 RepID=A0A2J7QAS7_9NEOP|nr:uncharacterized protein LOC111868745 [Cryptotermes secundus]PNF25669.1 hypothetical protein B7P43_G00633 [Cryptotermes secundus]